MGDEGESMCMYKLFILTPHRILSRRTSDCSRLSGAIPEPSVMDNIIGGNDRAKKNVEIEGEYSGLIKIPHIA